MELMTKQKVYLMDAVIDRIFGIKSKIMGIEDAFKSGTNKTNLLKVHLQELKNELSFLSEYKRYLEQEIYDAAHNVF
ncbi:hypothetical protein AB0Y20_00810 [Heyndrickxia oleronia]|uniref:hypothetical protein n=1 Tax=Heyndrickxia oleronia TaxID=38875 RepID=UPI003F280A9B